MAAVALLLPLAMVQPAHAATILSAAFSGGTVSAGTMYATPGSTVTLTVTADGATKCVDVTGAHVGRQTTGSSPFVFTLTATGTDGSRQVTIQAGNGNNGGGCNGNTDSRTASYVVDGTAPVVTGAASPAPNAAGWSKANVGITWTANDAGSGVASGPTPSSDTVTVEGTTTRTSSATDRLGATGTGSVTVKLDKTAPAILGSRTPAPFNSTGWNSTDVNVGFACGDPLSGVKSCSPSQTFTATGAVTGTAVDNADNSSSTAAFDVKIDRTAPTLSGAPTTPPNVNGWYRGDVTVHWAAADLQSGVVASPSDSTIAGEGVTLTASSSTTNNAGLTTNATSTPAVKIDRTGPTTTVTAPPAWNKTDVTLALVGNDGLSGVDSTFYRLDGGAQQSGTSVPVTAEGQHTLQVWSVDRAGNSETPHSVSFGIDKTSPMIGHSQSPAPNADGWNNTDVVVTFTCTDALSGVASCTAPVTVTTESKLHQVLGSVTDNAGNTATDPATVSIDKTRPTISVALDRPANVFGWYGANVTATFTCADQPTLSGIRSCAAPVTFDEGADQDATGWAEDNAGNQRSDSVTGVDVDTTPPSISGAAVTGPNAHGWYAGDVSVQWTCGDALSGVVVCPADSLVTGEGAALGASASVSDRAGHSTGGSVVGIAIDRTAPTTSAEDVPTGWQRTPVTVTLDSVDLLSGVDAVRYRVDGGPEQTGTQVVVATEGTSYVSYYAVDQAGNSEAPQSFTVRVDLSAPTVTALQTPGQNANGWNKTDVTVTFSCEDEPALSGVDFCPADVPVTTEGAGQQVSGTGTDVAGNASTATATVNLDKSAPTIHANPDRPPNANGWWDDDVTVSFACEDQAALSGVESCPASSLVGEGAGQSVSGTATDNAGNNASTTYDGIDVDETAPFLSAAPTTSPNAEGWYRDDVTLDWACFDDLSGIDGACPDDVVLHGEGSGLTATRSVVDLAGNPTTAASPPVRIDRTAPVTTVSSPSVWVNHSVSLELVPADALSGVAATAWTVDGGTEQTGTTIDLTAEGSHEMAFWSTDEAGNREATRHVTVRIDLSAPSIGHSQSPPKNGNGWNRTDVTVTFTCGDTLSGIGSCTAPQPVDAEGRDQAVHGTAVDNAGNTATDTALVSIDKTPPTVRGSRSPGANAHGWNNTDVTVHFTASDDLSGIDHVTHDVVLGEGQDQSVTGRAEDAAGNTASDVVGDVDVDTTAPTISGAPTTPPNTSGWYRHDVVVAWTCADALSGIATCPSVSTLDGEGADLSANGTAEDEAGNATTTEVAGIMIDRIAPTTGATAPSGWSKAPVTLSLEAHDGLSGVAATHYRIDDEDEQDGTSVVVASRGVHQVAFWSVDVAGNVEGESSVMVKVDLVDPTVRPTVTPAPNAAGWNRTAVQVTFDCDDDLSGVASCSPAADLGTEGADQPVPGTATDEAGNTHTETASVSIDTTDPTIHGSPDRAPNGNGWYDAAVTVTFTCADGLSGIADCSSPSTVHEGAGQAVRGTAHDVAGNAADDGVGPLNIDTTAPSITGTATTPPNGAGWYRDDVLVHWTCSDGLSGLAAGACHADDVLTGEGEHLTATALAEDRAGNSRSAISPQVRIDRHAPETTVSSVPEWSRSTVILQLRAIDNVSGVAATYYQLDSSPAAAGNEVTIASQGVHSLQVWSVDEAGNVEAQQNVRVQVDKTAPSISHMQTPPANPAGWNNDDVAVTFFCGDSLSGLASCAGSRTVSSEGARQLVEGTAIDNAGNTAADWASISLDRTKPTARASLSRPANSNSWYDDDVTVDYVCGDDLSGVNRCPSSRTFHEGLEQSDSGSARDTADNVTPVGIAHVNVDKTNPTIGGSTRTPPNTNGWFRNDVTVAWDCADALSGIVPGGCPADSTVVGEGANLGATAGVNDGAGNGATGVVSGVKIDRHDPQTTAHAPVDWQGTDVTVTFDAVDGLSGVDSTSYTVDGGPVIDGTSVTISAEGTHVVSYWSRDRAGNAETRETVTVRVDKSAPTISGTPTTSPNVAGWYRAPVTVRFTCGDQERLSGVASCGPDQTVAAEGTGSATGTAVDNAGNRRTATVTGIQVDTVAPSVVVTGVQEGGVYVLGGVPTAGCSASDGTSGVSSPCTGNRTGGLSNGVGSFTYTASATDRAGNGRAVSVAYRVVYGYGSTLFLQPVNDTAHQTGVATSIFKAGQTVPMKFQLRSSTGALVTTVDPPAWLTPAKGASVSAAVNESAYAAVADSGQDYRSDGGQYLYNWNTDKSQAGYYWRVGVALDDGQTYTVNVGLR